MAGSGGGGQNGGKLVRGQLPGTAGHISLILRAIGSYRGYVSRGQDRTWSDVGWQGGGSEGGGTGNWKSGEEGD